jgi:hypothetical protein
MATLKGRYKDPISGLSSEVDIKVDRDGIVQISGSAGSGSTSDASAANQLTEVGLLNQIVGRQGTAVTRQGGVAIAQSIFVVGANRIKQIDLRNGNTVPIYLQYHNVVTPSPGAIPVSGDIKAAPPAIGTSRGFLYIDNNNYPANYGSNTSVSLSLTENIYTPPSGAQLLLINFNLETIN